MSARERVEAKLDALRSNVLALPDPVLEAILDAGALDTMIAITRHATVANAVGNFRVGDVLGALARRLVKGSKR